MSEVLHIHEPVLIDKSAEGEYGTVYLGGRTRHLTVYVRWGPGTTEGTVSVFTASDPEYTGSWRFLGSATWESANSEYTLGFTGAFVAIRVYIARAVTGGTVSAWVVAN